MEYLEALTVEVDFNDDPEVLQPDNISFSMRSSIYKLLPTFTMEVNDVTGILQEFMYFLHGTKVTIRMGYDVNTKIESHYSVIGENVDEFTFPGTLSGIVTINGLHRWHSHQSVKSTAYKGSGSDVVQRLSGGYPFKASYVESTSGEHIWYQPYINDVDLIENVIVPNTVSIAAGNSPFLCWIDNGDRFTFQSANEILRSSQPDRGTVELEYYPDSNALKTIGVNTIFSLRRLHDTKDFVRETQNTNFFSIDRSTGEVKGRAWTVYDVVSEPQKVFPSFGDISYKTNMVDVGYTSSLPEDRRLNQARQIQVYKDTLFSDRFLVITQFNPKLSSGGKVNLKIHTALQEDTEDYSEYFSGNYVIETCEHTWDGSTKKAFTILVVGRRFVNMPARNAFKDRIIQNERPKL